MSKLILPRRRFLIGLGAALAAPAIVRFEILMPVHAILPPKREVLFKNMTFTGDFDNFALAENMLLRFENCFFKHISADDFWWRAQLSNANVSVSRSMFGVISNLGKIGG